MSLTKLYISNVRNITSASIEPSPHINLIVGENASGKSTVLESIFILGRGRSFRTASSRSVINEKSEHLLISGKTIKTTGQRLQIGIRFARQKRQIHINGQALRSRSQLIQALPVQLINPQSHSLLESGAKQRRQFLDWGVFHDDGSFLNAWKRYKRALDQRNALLKKGKSAILKIWDQEFIHYGTIVHEKRCAYIEKLEPVFNRIANRFLAVQNLEFDYFYGWNSAIGLDKSLHDDSTKDCRYGYTHSGPHRGDFLLRIDGKAAKDFVSRGQTKLLVIALKLTQMLLLPHNKGILLVDDLASELDIDHRRRVLELLTELESQIFITAIGLDDIGVLQSEQQQTFRTRQGDVQPLEVNQG